MGVVDRLTCFCEDLKARFFAPTEPDRDAWRSRDPRLAAWRDEVVGRHPRCQARSQQCFGNRRTHHIRPRHLFPELAYDPDNGITLCERHHFILGHGEDWAAWVPDVRRLAENSRVLGYSTGEDERKARGSRLYTRDPATIERVG